MEFWKDQSTVWWRSLAEKDPYYAVLTEDRWRGMQSGSGDADVFFEQGELFISRVLRDAQTRGFEIRTGGSAVEFGCGVGRLLLPLACRFRSVTGIDVSSAMIREAKANVELAGLRNVTLVASSGAVPDLEQTFELVLSAAVFQHIPSSRGERMIMDLVSLLSHGGVAIIQIIAGRRVSILKLTLDWIQRYLLPVLYVRNVIKGYPFNQAPIDTRVYNLNRLLAMLQERGYRSIAVTADCFDGICLDVTMIIQHPAVAK